MWFQDRVISHILSISTSFVSGYQSMFVLLSSAGLIPYGPLDRTYYVQPGSGTYH